MIATIAEEKTRRWSVTQQGDWLIYNLPNRLTKRARLQMIDDALFSGCRFYAGEGIFEGSPLIRLDAEEYRLLRLPDAAVKAVQGLCLAPAQCSAQIVANKVTLACEKTVKALADYCRDVTLVTADYLRAKYLQSRLMQECGLPLRIAEAPDVWARGIICTTGRASALLGVKPGQGRAVMAQDLFEVDYPCPATLPLTPTEAAGVLYAATRQAWLKNLAITRLLPLDK